MNLSIKASLLVCSLLLLSCKKEATSHDLNPASETKKIELSQADKESALAFADTLSTAFKENNTTQLEQIFNFDKLRDITLSGINLSSERMKAAATGFKNSLSRSKLQLIQTLGSSDMTFIRLVHETRPALLYRLIMPDSSFSYCEFLLEKNNSSNDWQVVDLYMYANGKRTSAIMRDSLAQMLPSNGKANKTLLEAMAKIPSIVAKNQSGQYNEAWKEWKNFPPETHSNRIILLQGYMAALQIYINESDHKPLRKVVAIMEKEFAGDAGLAIMQLSIYELNKDAKKYRETVQTIRNKVGDDPFLDLLECGADLLEKNYDKTLQVAQQFQKQEPENLLTYGYIWEALVAKKDFKALANSLTGFTKQFEAVASAFAEDPDFAPFFASPEGKAWLESQK